VGRKPKRVIVDLGYRGVDHENPCVEIVHRGKYRNLQGNNGEAQAASGDRAGDWASEGGSLDGLVLVEGRAGRSGAMRGGLQPALADMGDAASGPEGSFKIRNGQKSSEWSVAIPRKAQGPLQPTGAAPECGSTGLRLTDYR
jgi:hypothetical protein